MEKKLSKDVLLDVINRILLNSHIAKQLVEEGKEIYCGRKIDAVIDQLTRLASEISSSDLANSPESTEQA